MTIIVTGGAGFIGSNFIFYMLKEHPQDRIVCLDSLTYAGNLSTLAPVMDQPNFRFVKLDICDRPGVLRLKKSKSSNFVEAEPSEIRNEISLSAGSFLWRFKSFSGEKVYWSMLSTTFETAELNMVLIWFCSIKKSPCSCICIVQMLL